MIKTNGGSKAGGHMSVRIWINGIDYSCQIQTSMTLLQFIRDVAGLTGTKSSCENGECGACTVLLNTRPVRSCIILAVEADGARITTIEGLAQGQALHPIQKAFVEHGAVQCGFCIPGMLMASKALIDEHPEPSEEQVRYALGGHICRCGGYKAMSEAVQAVGQK
jgi:aerobic-type carbon monoxide dehydrogenase small subunit (CoxS/CutS family)